MACVGQHPGNCSHGGCGGLIHGEAGPHADGRHCRARLAELTLQHPAREKSQVLGIGVKVTPFPEPPVLRGSPGIQGRPGTRVVQPGHC